MLLQEVGAVIRSPNISCCCTSPLEYGTDVSLAHECIKEDAKCIFFVLKLGYYKTVRVHCTKSQRRRHGPKHGVSQKYIIYVFNKIKFLNVVGFCFGKLLN